MGVTHQHHHNRTGIYEKNNNENDDNVLYTPEQRNQQNSVPVRQPRFFLHSLSQNIDHSSEDENSDPHLSDLTEGAIQPIEHPSEDLSLPQPVSDDDSFVVPYFVSDDEIVIPSAIPATTFISRTPPESFPIIDPTIPQAIRIPWTDKNIFTQFPGVTYGRLIGSFIILIIICVVVIPVTLQTTNKNISIQPSQISSMTPSMSPIISKWHNDTQINININAEKADVDSLMGYSVSLSSDGNTLAVGGHKTFHVYSYLKQANNSSVWVKVFDLADMEPADNTMGNLSWKTVAALSSDGHNVVVGDALNSDSFQHGGAMMVFTNVDEGGKVVQWYQRGRTIYGNSHWMRSHSYVAIVDDGNRLAVSTNTHADGYAAIYDYDGSEWIEKINIEDNHESRGFMSLSPNGQFFAMGSSLHRLVDIYDLSSNTKLQTLVGVGTIDYGHSMSFSHDGTILAISSWSIGLVDLYRFDPQKLKYSLMTDPITVANVTGLGHSVSVSANGKYIAVGAVSHPSEEFFEFGEFDDYVFWIDRVSERGSVFVFRIGDDDWDEVGKFEHDKSLYDKIGWSVSISGSGDVIAFGGYGTGGEHGDGPNKRGQVGVYRSERVK